MFVKKDFDVLESDIKASAVNDRREMAVLEKTKGYLEANIKTEENNLKDLLQKR